jgi:hypothetical protein
MVYQFMGAVTEIRISFLDGLGRATAAKLACMSRYPQTSYNDLLNPNCSFVIGMNPKLGVVGARAVTRCISLNQGKVLSDRSVKMCSDYSNGVLRRVNQVTKYGISDFVTEFLVSAASDEVRKNFWCGSTDKEMFQILDERREAAYHSIFKDTSSSPLLEELRRSYGTTAGVEFCQRQAFGRVDTGLCAARATRGHDVLKWLVSILASSFYFATQEAELKRYPDRSYSQMLILVRNNGLPPTTTPPSTLSTTLFGHFAHAFKVCSRISA